MTDNKQSTITVEVNNRPLDLPNKSKFVKEMDSGQNLLAWVYCDDTTIEHRIWIGVRCRYKLINHILSIQRIYVAFCRLPTTRPKILSP